MSDPTLALLIALSVTMLIAVVLGCLCVMLSRRISRMCAAWRECGAPEFAPAIKKLDGELFDARTANASLAADVRQAIEQRDRLVRKYGVVRRKFRREQRRYTRVERALHAKSVELAEMKERAGITH